MDEIVMPNPPPGGEGPQIFEPPGNDNVSTHKHANKCRLCLEEITKGGGNLFEDASTTSLANFLQKSFQIKLDNKPNWPHLACEGCLSFIQDIRAFRQRMIATNITLSYEIVVKPKIIVPEKVPELKVEEPVPKNDDFYTDDSEDEDSEGNSHTEEDEDEETDPVPVKRVRGPPKERQEPSGDHLTWNMDQKLELHEELMAELDILNCLICGEKSKSLETLINHSSTVHDMKTCRVKCCNRKFVVPSELFQHLECHSDPEKFKCNVCGKTFLSHELMRNHKLKHSRKARELPCPTCGKVFKSLTSLRIHKQIHSKEFLCGDCGKIFAQEHKLRFHIQQIHEIKNRAVCELCGRAFAISKTMLEHMKTCGKAPKRKTKIKLKTTEDDLRPVSCVFCKADVPCAKLSDHAREEHGKMKVFLCKDCPVQFVSVSELGAHREKEHGGFGPELDCPYCDQKFKYYQAKYIHVKRKHPDKYQPREKKTQEGVEKSLDDLFLKK